MEAPVMRRSFRRRSTPEERRIVRNWTLGVLIVYGAVALTAFGVVGLHQQLANGWSKSATTELTTTAASKHQRHR
jgi:hypothetical protein